MHIFCILFLCLSDKKLFWNLVIHNHVINAVACTPVKAYCIILVFLVLFYMYYTFGGMSPVDFKSGTFDPTFTINVILPEVILLTKIIVNISTLFVFHVLIEV